MDPVFWCFGKVVVLTATGLLDRFRLEAVWSSKALGKEYELFFFLACAVQASHFQVAGGSEESFKHVKWKACLQFPAHFAMEATPPPELQIAHF